MTDNEYMLLALEIAKSTMGQTSPNPCVGAILVKNGKILSFGAHLQAGTNHAEINAINAANPNDLANSTLYVTLEPCCHTGRTAPCTDQIIKHKIKRVVIASIDKNPIVSRKGIQQLRNAGIEVISGVMEEQANELNKAFFHYVSTNRPYVTLKAALSLDGKYATSLRESKWITNEESRADGHSYRNMHDGILVGINTILEDNPSLTVRLPNCKNNPTRIVLDSTLRINPATKVLTDNKSNTIIITGSNYDHTKLNQIRNHELVKIIHLNTPHIEITDVLTLLAQHKITSLLVEGGQNIHNSFIQNKLFNELIMYFAPSLIGGNNAPAFFTGTGFAHLKDLVKLNFTEIQKIGDNLKIVAKMRA